jgi:glycosyltransferase involved in cell wall biosynthesis
MFMLMDELRKHGVQPIVLCPDGAAADYFKSKELDVRTCPDLPRLLSRFGAPLKRFRLLSFVVTLPGFLRIKRFRRLLKEIDPDLVHFNERSLIFAAKAAKLMGYPVVMHARSVACQEVNWAQRICESYIRNYVDTLVCIDQSVRQSLPDVPNATVVYNPLDQSQLFTDQNLWRTNDRKTLIFLNNLMIPKGIMDLLEAVRLLKHRNDFQLLICGGNTRPPSFFKTFRGRVAKMLGVVKDVEQQARQFVTHHGLEEHVTMKGFVNDLKPIIQNAYANIYPGHFNEVSRNVFESGIAGVPTIVSLRTNAADIVINDYNSLIIAEKNPALLAETIAHLLDSPELRDRLGENARNQFRQQFSKEKCATDVFAIYKKILNS